MLSSVAKRAYWVGRYLERAENTARIVSAYANLLLDLPREAGVEWRQMVEIVGCTAEFDSQRRWPLERSAIRFMTADARNSSSILSSLEEARENLRTLRDLVPKEAFESANQLYLFGRKRLGAVAGRRARFDVLAEVVGRCQRITGLMAGTMSHNEAYQFMRLGRNLERADMTSRIIDVAGDLFQKEGESGVGFEFRTILWVNVLRTLSAYQAYRQSVRSRIVSVRVIYFLLHDVQFPRTIAHCLREIRSSAASLPVNDPVMGAIDRVSAYVDALNLRGLARDSLHHDLDELQSELAVIHEAVSDTWLTPRR